MAANAGRLRLRVISWALALAALALAIATWPKGLPENADTFTHEGLRSGSRMTRDACERAASAVWVEVEGQSDCIRYFATGLEGGAGGGAVHLWIHGDRLTARWGMPRGYAVEVAAYRDNDPAVVADHARRMHDSHGLPFVRLSRPGAYGSSGDHKERRRLREVLLADAALDALKARYGIGRFHLSGQSGGGHTVAALLTRRRDIGCAVITSGVVAVRMRHELHGWETDATGYTDYFDPIDHVDEIAPDPQRRIFVVGDPDDSNVQFATQEAYFEALRRAGHRAWLIRAEGEHHHVLSGLGHEVVRWCAEGMPGDEIVARAEAG